MSTPKIIILIGDQGCGKTQRARELAAARGSYIEIDPEELGNRVARRLFREPAVLILTEPPSTPKQLAMLKSLVRFETIPLMRIRQSKPVEVRTPLVIITTNDVNFPNQLQRVPLEVIRMGSTAAVTTV